ncbi:MAG: MoaF C-terminal domain-containing protein [Steroidobacteraceae bacterium]
MTTPAGWKNYEDFAAGIDTNRLPSTDALAGKALRLVFAGYTLQLEFQSGNRLRWQQGPQSGEDACEVVEVAPHTCFIDITYGTKPREARTLIVNLATRRVLSILCVVAEKKVEGVPQVSQQFDVGVLEGGDASGIEPAPTRELIGLRTFQRYSPRHLYEHTYLSSERYCWQCLVGEQRGHGDVDLASYYKFDEQQYVFTFREFKIPVASVFFFNMRDLRSTGKFLGITAAGAVENNRAGAYIHKASMTFYEQGGEPV